MKLSAEGQGWLNATVQRILGRHHVPEPERSNLYYELMSHLHAAGEEEARSAGRDEVGVGELQAALLAMGGEEELAQAMVAPRAVPPKRADVLKRGAAYLIDLVVIIVAWAALVAIVDITLSILFLPFGGGPSIGGVDPFELWFGSFGRRGWGGAGFLFVFTTLLGYFTYLEGKTGQTLGKRVFALRVARVDGRPVTYREALIRSLAKLFPPLALLDALVMLCFFTQEAQRASDRLAETTVVEA